VAGVEASVSRRSPAARGSVLGRRSGRPRGATSLTDAIRQSPLDGGGGTMGSSRLIMSGMCTVATRQIFSSMIEP